MSCCKKELDEKFTPCEMKMCESEESKEKTTAELLESNLEVDEKKLKELCEGQTECGN